MKSLLIVLLFLLLTTTGSWAHGSEKHADLRSEPDKPDLAAGPPRVTTRQFQLSGGNLTVEFSQRPADPIAGDSLQLEANLKKKLDPPDPLLGDEMTLEGATVTVTEPVKLLPCPALLSPLLARLPL